MLRTWILLAPVVMVAAGCASLGPMTPPDVTLVDLEFTDMTVFETSGELTVRLTNENPDPLVLTGAVFKLYLNGVPVGTALASERLEVPRLGTATQAADLQISNVALAARLATMLEQPVLDYRIKTRLWVERPYGIRKVRLNHRGRFSFEGDGAGVADPGRLDLSPEEAPGDSAG